MIDLKDGGKYWTDTGRLVGPMKKVWINCFSAEGNTLEVWNGQGAPANEYTKTKIIQEVT